MKHTHLKIFTDGGARGNPGPAGTGFVIWDDDELVYRGGEYLGETTNNVAEYTAVIHALEKAKTLGGQKIALYLDSELVVKQLQQKYKVKNPDLAKLFVKVWNLMQQFSQVTFTHVPREQNTEADRQVNLAIDRGQ